MFEKVRVVKTSDNETWVNIDDLIMTLHFAEDQARKRTEQEMKKQCALHQRISSAVLAALSKQNGLTVELLEGANEAALKLKPISIPPKITFKDGSSWQANLKKSGLLDLISFLCSYAKDVDDLRMKVYSWKPENGDLREHLINQWPIIQGLRNQINLNKIAASGWQSKEVGKAVQMILDLQEKKDGEPKNKTG